MTSTSCSPSPIGAGTSATSSGGSINDEEKSHRADNLLMDLLDLFRLHCHLGIQWPGKVSHSGISVLGDNADLSIDDLQSLDGRLAS
jgi:hypothetical protein